MTKKQHLQTSAVAMLLLVAILSGTLGLFQQATGAPSGPIPTIQNDYNLHSTATIKTQKAADSIKGGIRGIDVSKYQGTINWKKVAKDDVSFVFVRASYGTVNDPKFLKNARQAHENGLHVGAYHYATFKNTSQMKQEAAHFISRLKKVDITYPVVLDLEDARHKKMKKSTLTKLAIQFMELVEAEGYDVMLYSGYNFIRDHIDSKKVKNNDYHFWIANYSERPKGIDHKVWQHTSSGKVKGIKGSVDINIAYEDLSTRKAARRTPPAASTEEIRPAPSTPETETSASVSSSSEGSSSSSGSKVSVDKSISDSIKNTLNSRYSVNLSLDNNSSKEMHEAISLGLQYEVNVQMDQNLPIDGQMRREQVRLINSNGFSKKSKSKFTFLVQARLFYLGFYAYTPSSVYDADTQAAVQAYQQSKGIEATGQLNEDTLMRLLL